MKNSFQINKIKQVKKCLYNIIMDDEFDTNINHWNEEDLLESIKNLKLMCKIIKADNVNNLIDKIKVDNDLNEYVDFDNNLNYDKLIYEGSNSFYLLLNDVFEFECELLK